MTLFKIAIASILFFITGTGISYLQKPSSNTQETSFQLPESQLKLEASVNFHSPAFNSNDHTNYSYELNVINNYDLDFQILMIEVFGTGDTESPIGRFDEKYLSEHLTFPGRDGYKLKANGFAVVGLWLEIANDVSPPSEIFHRIHFSHKKANGDIVHPTMDVAITTLPKLTNITLGLPFRSGNWFYTANHHRDTRMVFEGKARYPQRHAIDWIKVDEEGRYTRGNQTNNTNWITYGEEILAVSDGVIVDIKDGIPENQPDASEYAVDITRHTVAGNSIVIDLGGGVRAIYAHLIPSSIKVKEGDRVEKGQVIGLLGNSGNSDCPHLHFHLEADSKTFLGGEGISFHFPAYSQIEQYTDEELDDIWEFSLGILPIENLNPSDRKNELPTGNGLVKFN